ncbi:hypothetical protein HDU98_007456 [Podochytrium sp. JEL0797]|nr:hypothetical protein HDU98_007456 [Podochytrium sp. JEL0797]
MVHSQIPEFDRQLKAEPDPTPTTFNAPLSIPEIPPSDLLPPLPVLELLHSESKISIKPSEMYFIIAVVQSSWTSLHREDPTGKTRKALIDRLLAVCTLPDLTTLATLRLTPTPSPLTPAKQTLGIHLLHLASTAGSLDADFQIALSLSRGTPPPRNVPESLTRLRALVEKRHPLSMYVYAMRLIKQGANPPRGGEVDPIEVEGDTSNATPPTSSEPPPCIDEKMIAQGLRLLHTCATELSYPQALVQMGHLYLTGTLVQQDLAQGYALLERAADAGVAEAMFLCGTCWDKGEGVAGVDRVKALEWWKKAATKGLAVAQHNLGSTYFEDGPQKSIPLAVEYFEMAASQGFALSIMNLGKLYREGYVPKRGEPKGWRVDVDRGRAREYVGKVVEMGGEWEEVGKGFLESMDAEE